MISDWRKVLVLAPHTDDGEFGCGATLARLVDGGTEIRYVAFSIATRSLPDGFPPDALAREVREATAELGIPDAQLTVHDFEVRSFPEHRQEILELLIALWEDWQPDAVLQPSLRDTSSARYARSRSTSRSSTGATRIPSTSGTSRGRTGST
jgi:LmbE family N-acetylglucosaminyl deacetylase